MDKYNEEWQSAFNSSKLWLGNCASSEEVVEYAKEILREKNRKLFFKEHREYLKTFQWQEVRTKVLKRDNYLCQDCLNFNRINRIKEVFRVNGCIFEDFEILVSAEQVHHTDYSALGTCGEIDNCVSLCKNCHDLRHGKNTDLHKQLISKVYTKIREQTNWREILNNEHTKELRNMTVPYNSWKG